MSRTFIYCFQAMFVLGCQGEDITGLLGTAAGPLVGGGEAIGQNPAVTAAPGTAPEVLQVSQALRRGYDSKALSFYECASLDGSGNILGKGCTDGFVAFGPYVSAPASSDVTVNFVTESENDIVVMSDVVSDLGRQFHGGSGNQEIVAKQPKTLSYTIHMDEARQAVESRIMVRTARPTDFRISGFSLTIH